MTDQELLRKIQIDDDNELLNELQKKLMQEFAKPVQNQDFDLIDDLIKTIDEITGENRRTDEIAEKGILAVQRENHRLISNRRIKRLRWIVPAACLMLIVGTNVWTYTAYGMNAFSAAYQALNGGINVNLNSIHTQEVYSGNPFADEMKSICEENHITARIPGYIPEGFSPSDIYGDKQILSDRTILSFHFYNSNKKLNIGITVFNTLTDPSSIGIPTDHYEVTEQIVEDTVISVIKEESQYTATFVIEHTQYLIYADQLDYDECQRILNSMFQ